MKKEELKKIIEQTRKYKLEKVFESPKEYEEWLNNLNNKQIKNLISLEVDPSEIQFPLGIITNENILNCDDYQNRIKAMTKIKNGKGWYHLFGAFVSPNFLNSKHYYEDIDLISKAPSAQYPLWIIDKDEFINSPYHLEDLKLIVEAKDTIQDEDKKRDWLVACALTIVARNIESIKSPYHRKDMQLIANSGSNCLQMNNSYPEESINNLATNSVSLKDKYHLENMQILAKSPIASEYLYELMTDPDTIKSKYYRNEINALVNAKSIITATALYYYILNPNDNWKRSYRETLWDNHLDYDDYKEIERNNTVKGKENPNYLKNLALLNQIDDSVVLYIESLLSNKEIANNPYLEYDIKLLLNAKGKDTFIYLYKYLININPVNNKHHMKDMELISREENNEKRRWLLGKAINEESINSPYHEFDMEYITKLDKDNLSYATREDIHYYLFVPNGINHPEHIERLEKLAKGEKIEKGKAVSNYLDELEQNIDEYQEEPKENQTNKKEKILAKIKKFIQL